MTLSFLKKPGKILPTNSLQFLLHQHLSGPESGRPFKRVHASELTKQDGLCPRLYALADILKAQPKDEWLTTSSVVTFAIGRNVERNVVDWFADMKRIVGNWVCVSCGAVHEFQLRPLKCGTCGAKVFDHRETRFESEHSGASCGVDMLIKTSDPKLRLVELKSIDKDEFKLLKAPLAEHKWRTELYLRIVAESGHPKASLLDTSEAKILYVSKGGFGCADLGLKKLGINEGFSPFKEFSIKRNDKSTEPLSERARVVKRFRSGEIGMPCGVCPSALSKRAMSCPVRKECFSGDYPAVYDWKSA